MSEQSPNDQTASKLWASYRRIRLAYGLSLPEWDALDGKEQVAWKEFVAIQMEEPVTDNDPTAAQLKANGDYAAVKAKLDALLKVIGKPDTCSSEKCGAPILWITTKTGKHACYDPDGTSHWATCKDKDRFRGRK